MKMSQEKNQLFKEFEKEIWLFLDNDLPDARMRFWNQKLDENPELNKCVEDYLAISELYNEDKNVDLDIDKFNHMVETAISKSFLWSKVKDFMDKLFSNESDLGFGKIAFASVLIVMAVAISLISNRPNPVVNLTKTINEKLLDWDADFVDNQISKIGNLLKVTRDEEYRKYYKYKLTTTSVEKNINHINVNIDKLKEEINNKEL